MKSCFFIGHRDVGSQVLPQLVEVIERHITEHHVTTFFVGHYGGFDRLVARALKDAKQRHPEIRVVLVLPYHPAERPVKLPDGFDSSYYPWTDERIPRRLAIIKTNQYMVDSCDYLITYAYHFLGGTGQIVEYARKRESKGLLSVTNLASQASAL